MKKENKQTQSSINITNNNNNIKKIPYKREKTNNLKNIPNLTILTTRNSPENNFNDKNRNVSSKKLSKVSSFSKGWPQPQNKVVKTSRGNSKRDKSNTSSKCPIKNIYNDFHSRKESNSSTTINIIPNKFTHNKNMSRDFRIIRKKNLKINNISTPNVEVQILNNESNITTERKNVLKTEENQNLEDKSKNVKVFVRFRPSNELETSLLQNNYGWLVPKFISDKQLGIYTENLYEINSPNSEIPNNFIFSFDKVFSPNSDQTEIYSNVGKRIVEDIMAGYNGTIFAYGQSGSGKTYTMYGNDIYDNNSKGVIPRVVEEIFKRVEKADSDIDFQLKLSVLEIYKEVLFDLFTQENNLKIIENKEKGIYIENLSEVYLSSVDEFFNYVDLAQRNRKVAETKLNHNSSRSHCIMILEVIQNYKKEKIIKKGTLNLVDLAGSEKVSKTGAVGETLEEAKKINLSLSTLGNVIHALTKKLGHVPFRDSKLTRILKESLGGNFKTYLIVTCSPHSYNLDEIISSLQFAKRVKCIKNKYKINIKYSYEELQNLVDLLNGKLLSASEKIHKLLNGDKINLEEENKNANKNKNVCSNCELLTKEKKILESKIQELMDNIQEKDTEIEKLKEEIENLKNNKPNYISNNINNIPKNKSNNNSFRSKSKNSSRDNNLNTYNSNINNFNYNYFDNLNIISEANYSILAEKKKTDDLHQLYKKIKEKLSRIEEENERIKIIQNEEQEIRKINLKKEQFSKIIQDFVKNKDKLKCFEKMDNITKVSIPYVKDKDYKSLFNDFKNDICQIFAESFINKNNNISPDKLLEIITTNLFFEYLHFYFSQQIINQGYLKLILDNNSLYKMNKYLFDIVRDTLSENIDIANENVINAKAMNYLRVSMGESFISKPGSNNNIKNELNQKIVKYVSKNSIKNKLNSNNIIHETNPSFNGNIIDLKNNIPIYVNENYTAQFNKLKSQEYEKSSNKIQMIRNVLVSIIKETDYIRTDVKYLKENLNNIIKSIMNEFRQDILGTNSNEADFEDNNAIGNEQKFLKSRYNIESYNYSNNIVEDASKQPSVIYKKDNNSKKKIEIINNKNKNIIQRNNNEIYDFPSENNNPNITNGNLYNYTNYYSSNDEKTINKNSSTPLINLSSNSNQNKKINNLKTSNNNSNKMTKNNSNLKLIKKSTDGKSLKNINKRYLDTDYSKKKLNSISHLAKKLIQVKGDEVNNSNYFVLEGK